MEEVHTLEVLSNPSYKGEGFFNCNLCLENGSGPVFHCELCHFDLHLSCVASGPTETHFSHYQHPLVCKRSPTGLVIPLNCNLCTQPISSYHYECAPCGFRLHAHCVRAPRHLRHPSHSHILSLARKGEAYSGANGECWCDGCRLEVLGFSYHCETCRFDLHPACATLPGKPLLPAHPQHRCQLLTKPDYPTGTFACDHCDDIGTAWVYSCSSQCGFDVHPQCARLLHQVPEEIFTENSSTFTKSKELQEFLKAMKNVEPILQDLASTSVSAVHAPLGNCPRCLKGIDPELMKAMTQCGHAFRPSWKTHDSCQTSAPGCSDG